MGRAWGAPIPKHSNLCRRSNDWDRRRAPKPVLKRLRELAQIRAAECCEICRDLDNAIARRDGEFLPSRDLWKSVNATGRDQCRVMRAGVADDEGRTKALFS